MTDCIFCKIINGTIPTKFTYEDEKVVAFHDLHPKAPMHILLTPRQHIATLNDIDNDNYSIIAYMSKMAVKLAKKYGHANNGYRLIINCNAHGGQTVFHLHMHLLAGRELNEGMG